MNSFRIPSAAKLCLLFFLMMLSISMCFTLFTGKLNGDFYGVPLSLTVVEFTLLALFSLAPYLLSYQIYKWFSRTAPAPTVRVSNSALCFTFFMVTLWFMFLAVEFGVGVLGREIYDAPKLLTPIIQISNRINPFYLGVFFIVGYNGSKRVILLGIFLLVVLGLLRAGLGVFLYVLLALIIRNHRSLGGAFHRHLFKFVLSAALLFFIAPQLYALRSDLRDSEDVNIGLSATEVVTGRLVGRLSSISNAAFIAQNSDQFRSDVQVLDPLYFQRQAIAPLFGVWVIPQDIPERILINVNGGNFTDVSFMTGVVGNLTLAWYIHPGIALINVITIFLMILFCFFFANKLRLPYRNEICFMLLLYPLTSGVSNEFSSIGVSMLALVVLFKLQRLLRFR